MKSDVARELYLILDEYVLDEQLNRLIKDFIREKSTENMVWSDLTLLTHLMLGGNSPRKERAAALTELLVLLSDIADDLQDRDNIDKPWMKCEPAVTINALLALFAVAIGEIGASVSVSSMVGRLIARSVQGQQEDVSCSVRTEKDYIMMVERKAGSMIQLAYYMGYSLVDGVTAETTAALNELALCAGIAAQIENDARDVQRYDLKNDLLQKKRTLPVLYLLEECAEELPVLVDYYADRISREEFLAHKLEVLDGVQQSGCLEYCEVMQTLYLNRAQELFRSLPTVSPWAERFAELVFRSERVEQG